MCFYQHMYTFIKLHLLLPLNFYEHEHMAHYPAIESVCGCVWVCVCIHAQAGLLWHALYSTYACGRDTLWR
jgi:hypothetical protein